MNGFVIEFNRRTRARRVFEFNSIRNAVAFRLQSERSRESEDVEVVALSSMSLESLKRTHSRYFTGTDLTPQTV